MWVEVQGMGCKRAHVHPIDRARETFSRTGSRDAIGFAECVTVFLPSLAA
jgi:hypothetical protein